MDRLPRHVIAVAALALSGPLDEQRVTVFIEELPRERISRRLGLADSTSANRPLAQSLLDSLPELAADYPLVLPGMTFLFMPNFADEDRVRKQVVESSARERLATAVVSVLRRLDGRDNPACIQVLLQKPDAAQFAKCLDNVGNWRVRGR